MNKTIDLRELSTQDLQILVGPQDQYLKEIESAFQSLIILRDHHFIIDGKEEAFSILEELVRFVRINHSLSLSEVQFLIQNSQKAGLGLVDQIQIGRTSSGKRINPKTLGQYHFAKAMENNTIVVAIGPAGTGKTFLAVVKAVTALKNREVDRIVLTRPAVEAGESLGFLPGDLKEKVDLESITSIESEKPVNCGVQSEVMEALVSLGYSSSEAYKVLRSIEIGDLDTTEDMLKIALKKMAIF